MHRVRIRLELRTKIKVLSISSVETRAPEEKIWGEREREGEDRSYELF